MALITIAANFQHIPHKKKKTLYIFAMHWKVLVFLMKYVFSLQCTSLSFKALFLASVLNYLKS